MLLVYGVVLDNESMSEAENLPYRACDLIVNKMGGKIISDIKDSAYFKGKCCYVLTPDRYTLELIEDKR